MRTERSHPWGFDEGDPRLDIRRAAAQAQSATLHAEESDAGDVDGEDPRSTDWDDWAPREPERAAVGTSHR